MHDDDDKRHNSGRARNRSPAPHRGQTMTENGETPSLPRTRSTVVYRTPYGDDDDDHGNGCISPRQRSPSQTQRLDAPELPEARHRTHSASPASVTAPASNRSSLHGLHGPQRSSHRSSDHSRDTSTHHPHTSRRTFPDGSDAHPPLTPPLRAAVSPRTIPQHLSRVESGSPSWMVLESGSSSPGVSVAAGRTEDAPAAVSPPSLSFPDHPDSFHGASGFAEDCTTASLTPPMGSQGGKVMMVELEGDETEARPTGRIPDFSGFGNRRNDCYACSILTMLLRCPTFRQGLLHSPLHRASRHLEWLLQGASAPLPPEGWGSGYLPLPITGGGAGKRSRSPSTSSPSSQPPPPTRSPRRGAPSKKQKRTTSNTNGTTKQSEDALAAEQERRRCGLDLGIAELVVALSLEVGSSSGSSSSSATASATSISNEVNSEEHAAGDEAEQDDTQPDREPMVAIPDVYRYIHNVLSSFVAEQRRREGLIQRLHTPAHFPNRGRIYRQFVRRYELSMNGRAVASSDDDGEDDEDNVIGYAPGPSLYERGVILHPLAACFDDDFFTGEQEDAHEFFVALVARLESEAMLFDRRLAEVRELKEDEEENLKRDVTSVAVLPPKEVWINELLQGRLLNMIRCMNDTCRHEIVTEETFINISISFPEKPQPAEPLFEERIADAPVEIPNLATLLHRSMEYEALDGYRCDKCGSTSQQFQGGCFLGTPPSMLIVQLKRFHISFEQGQAVMRKDDQKVGVPEDLTVYSLPLELIRPCSSDEDKEESANDRDNEEGENSTVSEQNSLAKTLDDSLVAARGRAEAQSGAQSATNTGKCSPDTFIDCLEVTYRIHGVVLHVGRSLQSGHYIAFFAVRGPSSSGVAEEVQWKLANDEEVGDVDLDLLHDRTSHGYMFVFEKVREQRVRRPVGDVLPLAVNGPTSKASLC